MQAGASKRPVPSILVLFALLASLTLAGCHSESSNKTGCTGVSCPACETQIHVAPITGLTHTVCICPECKKVSSLDAATQAKVEAFAGGDIGNTVRVCDKCEAIVQQCAVCREK